MSRIQRRAILLFWSVVAIAAAAVLATGIRIDNSVSVWFAADDPELGEYRQSLADFGEREWILVAMTRTAADSSALSDDRAVLVERLKHTAEVHTVLSLADFPPNAPFVRQFLRPDSLGVAEALLVQVTNDIVRQDGYREAMVAAIREAGTGLVTIRALQIAGIAVINGELNRSARRDMCLFFPAVTVLLALLGALLFRNVRDTAVLLSVALVTLLATMGLIVAVGYPLNMVTIMLPTVLIALSVADVVHLIAVFHENRIRHDDGVQAARRAIRAIAVPSLGTTLTTIAGFIAFAGSSVLPIYQLAVFGAIGVALAWIVTMTAGAALLVTLWRRSLRVEPRAAAFTARIVGAFSASAIRHPAWTVVAFVACGTTLLGITTLKADTDYVRFFRSDSRVPQDYAALQRGGFPQNPLTLVVELPGEPDALGRHWPSLFSFVTRLEALPGVHAVLSPFSVAESPAALLAAGGALGLLSQDARKLQVTVMMDYPSSHDLLATLNDIGALAAEVLPRDVRVTPTGTSLLWARMDEGVIRTQTSSLLIVCAVCFAILALVFKSWRLALIGMLVSFYPVAIVLGIMGLCGIPLNMATVLIAGIAVGLAVDDTIHFVHAWQANRRNGLDQLQACRVATEQVGMRMMTTSVILIGSFAVMGLSTFMPTAQFGVLTSITLALALVADLALLPVLLTQLRWRFV